MLFSDCKSLIFKACFGLGLAALLSLAKADPVLNWQFDVIDPNNTGPASGSTNFAVDSARKFYQESVSIDGQDYFHQILGDPFSGFAIDIYIERIGVFGSPAAGISVGGISERNPNSNRFHKVDSISGIGTNRPTSVLMRMLLFDEEIVSELYKPIRENKPRMTQILDDGMAESTFVSDATQISYFDSIAAPTINRLKIKDPGIPQGADDWDQEFDGDVVSVSAGKVIYVPSLPGQVPNSMDGGGGTYLYDGGSGFDPTNHNWSLYVQPGQSNNLPQLP